MFNPTRRNKNIGTSNQGFGQNNSLKIPNPNNNLKSYYERLTKYEKKNISLNNHDFIFVIEETREDSLHACNVEEIIKIIEKVPKEDYGDLKYIILRQPKRKEEILRPVWGRVIYSYEFEDNYSPAIILESFELNKKIKWTKNLKIEDQKEIELLRNEGHKIEFDGKNYIFELEKENVKKTQLYRTLLHEFGHYVHYLEKVVRVSKDEEEFEKHEDLYFKISTTEKENFANKYAEKIRKLIIE